MIDPRPPAAARWLLLKVTSSADRDFLVGDLDEGFMRRAAVDPGAARRWYRWQVIRSLAHRAPWRAGDQRKPGFSAAATWRSLTSEAWAALRGLVRRPQSALLAVVTVVLGVTASSTLFTFAWSTLYRPLPYPSADRLVQVWEGRQGGAPVAQRRLLTVTYDAWRETTTGAGVEELSAYGEARWTLDGASGAERLWIAQVRSNLLSMLGAVPARGRLLAGDDAADVAVISERLAEREFGLGRAIGQSVRLDGEQYTVVGTLPGDFGFPSADTDVWLPIDWATYVSPGEGIDEVRAIARLAPGTAPEQVAAALEVAARTAPPVVSDIQRLFFGSDGDVEVFVVPLLELEVAGVRPALQLLLAGVGLLMLTAIASLAGLHLARTSDRRRELAIRAAIGAARSRLAMQLLAEAMWISLVGGGIAILMTRWVLEMAPAALPAGFPRVEALEFSGVTLAAAFGLAVVTGLLIGLLPALEAGRLRLAGAITDDGRAPVGIRGGSTASRWRRRIIVGQVAVATVLLVLAGLVSRTLAVIMAEDLGYAPSNVIVGRLIAADSEQRVTADDLDRLTAALEGRPDVAAVALASALPFRAGSGRMNFAFRLGSDGESEIPARASENDVTPAYFHMLGMRLVEGRFLDDGDYGRARPAMVVNEAFARAYLGDNWLGPLAVGGEVVGVVEDIKDRGPGDPVDPQIFVLHDGNRAGTSLRRPLNVFLRTTGPPDGVIASLSDTVRLVDGRLGLADVTTVAERLSAMVAGPRLYAMVVGAFAGLAVLIATVGLFGTLAHLVSRMTREIGIRTALGATPRSIAVGVLTDGLALTSVGIVVGLALAAGVVRYASAILYGVSIYDPFVFTLVPAFIVVVAAVACLAPARRAARIDPLRALK